MLILIPWLPFSWAGIQLSKQKARKRAEGWFEFSVQISLLELVYNTKHFCSHCAFAEFTTEIWFLLLSSEQQETLYCRKKKKNSFPKYWVIDVNCWREKYFGNLCIIHSKHDPLLSSADAVFSVGHGKSVLLLSVSLFYPLMGGLLSKFEKL